MKKSLALILAIVTILCVALTGCGGSSTNATICIGPYPDSIDPAKNTTLDGASYVIHAFAGLTGYNEKGELVADCATEIPEAVKLEDGKVSYAFTLKDDLKWSDGSALTAEDFVWAWNRAVDPATTADYAYMLDVVDGYDKASTGEGKLNVTASEDGKTLTVVLTNDVPYFMELCAFPTYMPVKKDVVEGNDAWATKAETYIGNGPYKAVELTNAKLVLQKNEYYHNADAVKTEKITCAFNEDDSSILTNYKNGSYLFIDSVSNNQIKTVKEQYPDEFQTVGQLGTYYVSFNVNDPVFADYTYDEQVAIRKALGLLLERNYLCDEIDKTGRIPANSFVPIDMPDANGEFTDNNGVNRDGSGYFSVNKDDYKANCDEAIELLKGVAESSGKFTVSADGVLTGFPTITYITNADTTHEAIATYMQATYKTYGITLDIQVQEWSTFVDTRKSGDYSMARNGWVADYKDPISFLDMWLSDSGNNDCQLGKEGGKHAELAIYSYNGQDGLTWAESYDKLIAEIKATSDPTKRFELMHQAEDMIMATGAICPLSYYTDIFMCSEKIDGFFTSALGYKYFMYATFE